MLKNLVLMGLLVGVSTTSLAQSRDEVLRLKSDVTEIEAVMARPSRSPETYRPLVKALREKRLALSASADADLRSLDVSLLRLEAAVGLPVEPQSVHATVTFSGRVLNEITGEGMPGITVQGYDLEKQFWYSTATNMRGEFFLETRAGNVTIETHHRSYGSERAGPFAVPESVSITNIELRVSRGGGIAGRYVSAMTGGPLSGVIHLYDVSGALVHSFSVYSTRYESPFTIPPGTYVVVAEAPAHTAQQFPALDCPCPITAASRTIEVTAGNSTADVDFSLSQSGTLRGRVFDAVTNRADFEYAYVSIYDTTGAVKQTTGLQRDGSFGVTLADGAYRLVAHAGAAYRPTVYGGGPCPPYPDRCDVLSGTPVIVTQSQPATADIAVSPHFEHLSGRVIDAATRAPIESATVLAAFPNRIGFWYYLAGTTAADGTWKIAPDQAGGAIWFHVFAPGYIGFTENPTSADEQQDFELTRRAAVVSGVTFSSNGDLVPTSVSLHDAAGTIVESQWTNGTYSLDVRAEGPAFLVGKPQNGPSSLYGNGVCPESGCDFGAATPLTIERGDDLDDLHIEIFPSPDPTHVSGTVVSQITGLPIVTGNAILTNTATGTSYPASIEYGSIGFSVPAGVYTLEAKAPGYITECFDNVGCGTEAVTQIKISGSTYSLPAIELAPAVGRIIGTVTDVRTGAGLPALVSAYDRVTLQYLGTTSTNASGTYALESWSGSPLPAGDYVLMARPGYATPGQTEMYDNIPCGQTPCDPSDPRATSVRVSTDANTPGINFDLLPIYITSVAPATGTIAGGTPIKITGYGFTAGTRLRMDGIDAGIVSVTANAITAITPSHSRGWVTIDVIDPSGHVLSRPRAFAFIDFQQPAPYLVADLTPGHIEAAAGWPESILAVQDSALFQLRTGYSDVTTWLANGDEFRPLDSGSGLPADCVSTVRGLLCGSYGTSFATLLDGNGVTEALPFRGHSMRKVGDQIYFLEDVSGNTTLSIFDIATDQVIRLANVSNSGNLRVVAADGRRFVWIGNELWTTDGTPSNTAFVTAITGGQVTGSAPMGSRIAFIVYNKFGETGLFVSDGTEAGTVSVFVWREEYLASRIHPAGDRVVIATGTYYERRKLWTSDGTTAGTIPLAPDVTVSPDATFFVAGRLLFINDLVTDGTEEGTTTIQSAVPSVPTQGAHAFTGADDRFFFVAYDADGMRHLVAVNQELEGRIVVAIPPSVPRGIVELAPAGSRVYFRTASVAFYTEGSVVHSYAEATRRAASSTLYMRRGANDRLFFFKAVPRGSYDSTYEAWSSDGSGNGTVKFFEYPPHCGSFASTSFRNRFFFMNEGRYCGGQIWASDGSAAGTLPATPLGLGDESSQIVSTADFMLVYSDRKMYRSNASVSGTFEIARTTNVPRHSTACGDRAYWINDRGASYSYSELWATDGTTAGTVKIHDIDTGGYPWERGCSGSTLVYVNVVSGRHTVGSTTGSVATTQTLASYDNVLAITSGHGRAYVFTSAANEPLTIVRTDGSPGGTSVFSTLSMPAAYVQAAPLRDLLIVQLHHAGGGKMFALQPDGSSAVLRTGSNVQNLLSVPGKVLFKVDTGLASESGWWETRGHDYDTIPLPFQLHYPLQVGSRLYFSHYDATTGRELWAIDNEHTPSVTSVSPSSGDAGTQLTLRLSGGTFAPGMEYSIDFRSASVASQSPNDVVITGESKHPGTLTTIGVRDGIDLFFENLFFTNFIDVSQRHPLQRFVEILIRKHITAGCGGGNYCPDRELSRQEAAVFLLRGKEGPAYVPPPATGIFADVPPGSPFAPWVEELARRGITAGCTPDSFCPTQPVTREQIAVLLLTTLEGGGYRPVPASGVFTDVSNSSPFARWVEELHRRGITAGCGVTQFCPGRSVTRGEIAVFLVKTFGL